MRKYNLQRWNRIQLQNIAKINEKKEVAMLLMQPKTHFCQLESLDEKLNDFVGTKNKEKEVVRILKRNNFNADLICYNIKNKKYFLNEKNKIKQFAFSPELIKERDIKNGIDEIVYLFFRIPHSLLWG